LDIFEYIISDLSQSKGASTEHDDLNDGLANRCQDRCWFLARSQVLLVWYSVLGWRGTIHNIVTCISPKKPEEPSPRHISETDVPCNNVWNIATFARNNSPNVYRDTMVYQFTIHAACGIEQVPTRNGSIGDPPIVQFPVFILNFDA